MAYYDNKQRPNARASVVSRIQQHASRILQQEYDRYINPMRLIGRVTDLFNINRGDIETLKNGQWEIYNPRFHCYLGLQVHCLTEGTEQLLRDFQVEHTEMRRNKMYNDYVKQNRGYEPRDVYDLLKWKPNLTESEAEKILYPDSNSLENVGDCDICCQPAFPYPPANRHICKVRGVFACYQHRKTSQFSVSSCLLDPETGRPYTRYACAKCGDYAEFVRFDLRESNAETAHRKDLCEACGIWGDCRVPCMQPCAVYQVVNAYQEPQYWAPSRDGTGVHCVFEFDGYEHKFNIVPYVYCVYANIRAPMPRKQNSTGRTKKSNSQYPQKKKSNKQRNKRVRSGQSGKSQKRKGNKTATGNRKKNKAKK